jgi:nucleotidyltransferase substrate binding protein (TIGR01987 family)
MNKIAVAIENLINANAILQRFLAEPVRSERDRAGVIQAFEFTYEVAWKALKKLAEEKGNKILGPRDAFMFALQAGYITPQSEASWLKMSEDRNLTSHTYKEELAKTVFQRIELTYAPAWAWLAAR